MTTDVNRMSMVIEDAVKELIRLFLQRAQMEQKPPESEQSSDTSIRKYSFYNFPLNQSFGKYRNHPFTSAVHISC